MLEILLDILKSLFGSKTPEPPVFEIIDKTADLPKHTTRTWGVRPTKGIKWIVIHQAASTGSVENMAKYHSTPGKQNHLTSKGAPGLAYHYAITRDGDIWKCTEDTKLTWHVSKKNTPSLGILVAGNFSGPSHTGLEEPTEKQIAALNYLLGILKSRYLNAEIKGHCELSSYKENCPGTVLMHEVILYRS